MQQAEEERHSRHANDTNGYVVDVEIVREWWPSTIRAEATPKTEDESIQKEANPNQNADDGKGCQPFVVQMSDL